VAEIGSHSFSFGKAFSSDCKGDAPRLLPTWLSKPQDFLEMSFLTARLRLASLDIDLDRAQAIPEPDICRPLAYNELFTMIMEPGESFDAFCTRWFACLNSPGLHDEPIAFKLKLASFTRSVAANSAFIPGFDTRLLYTAHDMPTIIAMFEAHALYARLVSLLALTEKLNVARSSLDNDHDSKDAYTADKYAASFTSTSVLVDLDKARGGPCPRASLTLQVLR
jgi:hypothetical protein